MTEPGRWRGHRKARRPFDVKHCQTHLWISQRSSRKYPSSNPTYEIEKGVTEWGVSERSELFRWISYCILLATTYWTAYISRGISCMVKKDVRGSHQRSDTGTGSVKSQHTTSTSRERASGVWPKGGAYRSSILVLAS